MPELPEVEALRRALDDPVSAFPIAKAGPAHIATLKTFDPPLRVLEGRRFSGAERRGKRLLFPTEDGELVLLLHMMSAGRIKYLAAGEKGPKTPAFQLEFQGGGRLVMTEGGPKKRAGAWLLSPEAAEAESAHLGPEALGLGAERARRDPRAATRAGCTRCCATSGCSPGSAARGRTRSSTWPGCRRSRSRPSSRPRRWTPARPARDRLGSCAPRRASRLRRARIAQVD